MKKTLPLHSARRAAVALAAALVLFAGRAEAQTATAIAQRLQQRYQALDALKADFVQNVGGSTLRGTLTVRGDAFRIELPDQTLVSDGSTLWSYTPDDNQVVVQDYSEDDLGFSIGMVFTDYLQVFRPTGATRATISGVRHDVLALVPRTDGSPVRDATLYVRSSDAVPTRVRVHDVEGRTLAFDLSNVQLNPRLGADAFTFRYPRGVEVIDLRS
jgi:chaperone LolA